MFNYKKILVILSLFLFFGLCEINANIQIITLKGGQQLQAQILKRSTDYIIVDMGFTLQRIPKSAIISIRQKVKTSNLSAGELFTTSSKDVMRLLGGVQGIAASVVHIKTPSGSGSGFFVNNKGYLITNFHVVKGQRHISVIRYKHQNGELRRFTHKNVRIVALDPFHDLAVLQINSFKKNDLVPVVFHNASAPNKPVVILGENVFAIGNPLGLERTVTQGVISHTSRNFEGKLYLQIDAPINPGNSGGPLFNSLGQVVGVINMGALSFQGLNFAIPIRHVTFLLNNIEAYGYDENNSESGYFYPLAPRNPQSAKLNK